MLEGAILYSLHLVPSKAHTQTVVPSVQGKSVRHGFIQEQKKATPEKMALV